jgi:hypothetical protein
MAEIKAVEPLVDSFDKPTGESGYKAIKSETGTTVKEAKEFLNALFNKAIDDCFKGNADDTDLIKNADNNEDVDDTKLDDIKDLGKGEPHNNVKNNTENARETDNAENNLEKTVNEYFDDLRDKSECPETILERPFETSDLEKLSPEEVAERRAEFDDKKAEMKKQWEAENGCPWPKYEHDVYSPNGKLIRKAGSDYDAHHIQPLGMGGKNEVSNITPLHAEMHYDRQGIHSPNSPYSKMDMILGGID